jgi:hypothetical protein
MKRLIIFLIFTCFCFAAKAQAYAIISDKDGFVNIRKEKSANAPIVARIYNDSIFNIGDEDNDGESDWIKIYMEGGTEGYVYKSRILALSKLKFLKNIKIYKDSCVAINDSLAVTIKSKTFNSKFHKLTYSKAIPDKNIREELLKIDGHRIWGTDGDLPKTKVVCLKAVKNGIPITIPDMAFNDLYEPNFKSIHVYIGKNDTFYIEMDNSDGAGAYSIIWIIKNNHYLKRYIDNIDA